VSVVDRGGRSAIVAREQRYTVDQMGEISLENRIELLVLCWVQYNSNHTITSNNSHGQVLLLYSVGT
jgi:hypothetical protein